LDEVTGDDPVKVDAAGDLLTAGRASIPFNGVESCFIGAVDDGRNNISVPQRFDIGDVFGYLESQAT